MADARFRLGSGFRWTEKRSAVAVALAEGGTQEEIARANGITDRAIRKWLAEPEFSMEVDRLSMMIGMANRAERLRLANRVIREKIRGELVQTDKDVLDWIKFAQSETDGINLNLAAAFLEAMAKMAPGGPGGLPGEESEVGARRLAS